MSHIQPQGMILFRAMWYVMSLFLRLKHVDHWVQATPAARSSAVSLSGFHWLNHARSIVWWILCANHVLGRQNQTAGCLTNHSQVSVRCRASERERETHTTDTHAQTNTKSRILSWLAYQSWSHSGHLHPFAWKKPWVMVPKRPPKRSGVHVRIPTWLPRQHIFFFYQRPDILNEHNEPVDAHKARLHSCFRGIDGQNLDLIISRVDASTSHKHSINIILYHTHIYIFLIYHRFRALVVPPTDLFPWFPWWVDHLLICFHLPAMLWRQSSYFNRCWANNATNIVISTCCWCRWWNMM